jgi:transketolase
MTTNAQSGHPGGSLSSIDYLSLLYTFVISRTEERVVVSNGHISPAVYAVLAELGIIPKKEMVETFRKAGSVYEGHVTRHVRGIDYGTGPLGVGVSAATGFALAEKLQNTDRHVYALMGDGEAQEGQVYEMMNFAHKHRLNNLVLFVDHNRVQLSDSLTEIMPLDIGALFKAGGWKVISVDAHDFRALWKALGQAHKIKDRPVLLLGHSVMGKGVEFMEAEGLAHKATWHGATPKPADTERVLKASALTPLEQKLLEEFRVEMKWNPAKATFPAPLSSVKIDTGTPVTYEAWKAVDCRSAYGKALADLARLNPSILAATADLRDSVKTAGVIEVDPKRHIECGIAEQQMVSMGGGLSLSGFIPFVSTFGAFMTSRAKDQARVNDINQTNVKMVATHCGLSVGEDGPTHQAIDDMGSMLGLLNTMVLEPADANQTDRMIRFVAAHYGNFYVRMGRHKFNPITKENGTPFYDADYVYLYGRCDVIRPGNDLTLIASGSMVSEALKAWEALRKNSPHLSVELVAVTAPKQFDETLWKSLEKTKKAVVVEDHNPYSGFGSQIARQAVLEEVRLERFETLGVTEYQLSGQWNELYASAGIDAAEIAKVCEAIGA